MKIYFCDKCSESIPLSAINSNRISIDGGRIYCEACAPKTANPAARANYAMILVAAVLGLGLGVTVMALGGRNLLGGSDQEKTLSDKVSRLETTLVNQKNEYGERLAAIESDLEESARTDGKAGKLAATRKQIASNGTAIQSLRENYNGMADELRSKVASQAKEIAQIRQDAKSLVDDNLASLNEKVTQDIDRILQRLQALEGGVSELKGNLKELKEGGIGGGAANGEGKANAGESSTKNKMPVLSEEKQKRFDELLAQLKSDSAPKRFAAIVELGDDFKFQRTAEVVVEALNDEAEYVITEALNILMELNARWAIPEIIPKVKDKNHFIRDTAVAALQKLMGRSLAIDPEAPMPKLVAKVRELEDWWKKNKKSILAEK